MKSYKSLSVLVILLILSASVESQSVKKTKEQAKHDSSYDYKTMSPTDNPNLLPYNRWISPAGKQVYFGNPSLENHAMDVALSPDGKWVAVEGRYEVVVMSAETGKLEANLPMAGLVEKQNLMNTFSGISWLQENNQYKLFWGAVGNKGVSYVLSASWDGKKLNKSESIIFEKEAPAESALVNEVLTENESGKNFLYIVLNGTNKVVKYDLGAKTIVWKTDVGVAPFGITRASGKLYVTNWAGSVPDKSDVNVAGVPWGSAKVDPRTGATREGTVSVLDPATGKVLKEIIVGLHPNDIVASADGKTVFVSNANSDNVSVISTGKNEVVETISVRLNPEKNSFWGDSPNGLGLSKDGKILYVANGMDNALCAISLGKKAGGNSSESSKVMGFIPTEAYPGAILETNKKQLFVANIEGESAKIPTQTEGSLKPSYNSHKQTASVSVIDVPTDSQLKEFTKTVEQSNQHFRLALLEKMPRKNVAPTCVPERIGEPSVFKHVLYIIKENRTYDQILGDVQKGDGDSTLTIFGKQITPNTHALVDQYMLLDNFYVSGKCSAEGHQWTDASIVTDYVEKDVRAWIRSYPHVQEDALVYTPTGFIWDNAIKHGKSVRIYGEASTPKYDEKYTWTSIYQGFLKGEKFEFTNHTTVKPVEAILSPGYPSYDDHKIPDALRSKAFIDELKRYEAMDGDQLPELMVMALPCDHTGGTRPGLPTPRAMVADNDLALGQIIEALTKSRFWKNTVVFVTEDDSQSGWDHVSAYRTVGMIISPYSRTGTVMRTNYNQPSMVRTMEQILGMQPMNIMDATAKPMFDCFVAKPDYTPFQALKNQIPLDEMNPPLSALKGEALHYAKKSMEPQFDGIDSGDDQLFNRIIWYAMRGKAKFPKRFCGEDDDD
ncbi:MAG TPA: bifunctional YncE family protein/alkaline phosphatase family protein [Prolixibacteraceae bacterium]|nr:bifunctional YncE family protein/alkaline phosphatase family protein [Prolixibacteraceae bacterium]